MLWLSDGPCKVPPFATHHCGVGAIIIDENDNILVVKEHKNSKLVGWKLPGGYANLGENLLKNHFHRFGECVVILEL
jgi:ADP-ribose pyrophosphatase YjhB (NUDIX family)